ncbi:DNA-binding protein [uncultured Prevotella sp.]|uniref:HU family DNA-binding protein n=1 Tax=uncultured Prevotella sp. TaxID=159272 RepID=UPI0026151BBE|nr:DNA-binding protein [uncultured Prevotella sp.]
MINYTVNQSNRKGDTNGKWYARAVHTETVDLQGLAEHMCSHNCGYSKGMIRGLLDDLVVCLRAITQSGRAVKLPDLGIFKPAIRSKGALTAKEYNVKDDVIQVRMAFLPSGLMKLNADYYKGNLKFRRLYKVVETQVEPGNPGENGGQVQTNN